MAKLRDFMYGSPKFERKLNKRMTDASKVYQHHIVIQASDANNNSYYCEYAVYSNKSDSLFTTYSPTISDVVDIIKKTWFRKQTPPYLDTTGFVYFYYTGSAETLKAQKYVFSTNQSSSGTITTIISAEDDVKEI